MRILVTLLLFAVTAQAQDFGPSTAEIDDYVYEEGTRKFVPVEAQEEGAPSSWSYEIRAGIWIPDIDGPIAASGQADLDLGDIFGLDDVALGTTLTIAAIKNEKFLIDVDMYWVSYEGERIVQQEFMLGGNTYEIDQALLTDLDIAAAKIHVGWCVYNPNDAINIGVYVALTVLNLSGGVDSVDNTTGTVEHSSFDLTIPVPTIGAALWGDIGKGWIYSISIDGIGIALSSSDSEWLKQVGGSAWESKASIGYRLGEKSFVRAGYRYAYVEAYLDNIQGSVTIKFSLRGFFLEFGYRF